MSYLDMPDNIKYSVLIQGLSEQNIRKISLFLQEPSRMLEHRLTSLKIFLSKPMPKWGLDLSDLDFSQIIYFALPEALEKFATNWNNVPIEIKNKFEALGIPEAERKFLAGAGGQFDSKSIYHKFKEKRTRKGIVFLDMQEALIQHEELVRKYFMKLVPPTDHKFAALHGAVWSGGSFLYIPANIKLDEPVQAYFRMNTIHGGQFEHTLIILEENSQGMYIEGCSAPKYNIRSLHAGCVEIYLQKNSRMRYASVENWSINTYNLNTKRAILAENSYIEWIGGNFGSGKSMLYPMSILHGNNSKADHLGVSFANSSGQEQDLGVKVVHIGENTSSQIINKSICKDGGKSIYRGLVKINGSAHNSINSTRCDTLLLDKLSSSQTFPNITCINNSSIISHEASAGKIDENNLNYLLSKGISLGEAKSLLVNGFINPIIKKLPLEYAGELNKIIEIEINK